MNWIKIFLNDDDARQKLKAGKPQLLILNSKRICLVLHKNTFFAFQDTCTHSGASLSEGVVNYLGEIVCPLHNYCFDVQSGRESNARSRDLTTFPLKIDESGFFVGI